MSDELVPTTTPDSSALVPTVVDQPMDFTIIARSPQEMATAQKSMVLWAAREPTQSLYASKRVELEALRNRLDQQFPDLCGSAAWSAAAWKGTRCCPN